MQQTRQNLLVGLFVLCGLIFLGVLIVMFGSGPTALLGGAGYPLHIRFETAAGIRPGNLVMVGGITIGRVQRVDFMDQEQFDQGVKVTALIESQYEIPKGSHAVAFKPGIGQGRPPIEIIPGGAGQPRLPPDSFILGEMRGAVESLMPKEVVDTLQKTATQVGQAASDLSPVLRDLHEVLTKRGPAEVDRLGGPQGNLSSAMARLDASLKHFNGVLGDPDTQSHLKEAIANIRTISEDGKVAVAEFRAASEKMRAVMDDGQALIEKTHATVDRLDEEVAARGRELRGVLERGSSVLDSLNEVASAISRGEGTVGRFVRDAKLYEALVLTAERMAAAVEEFRLLVKEWQKGKIHVAF